MPDADHKERMAKLEERLAAARKAQEPKPRSEEHYSQAQHAWRMVIELVAGLGIGATLGFGLDTLLGIAPFGLVIFTLLGFAAGVKTMMRSATEMQRQGLLDAEAAQRDHGTGGGGAAPDPGHEEGTRNGDRSG